MFIILETILLIIGGATVLFRIIAPLTKNKLDDKILCWLTKILEIVSLHKADNSVNIKINNK